MEFRFSVNEIFKQPIVEVNQTMIPPGFTGDRRALWDAITKTSEVVNAMGEASAAAQGLTKPITTAERLRNSEHKLYLLVDQQAANGRGAITGMLKVGRKGLYVFDRHGQHYQVTPACVLDFYVHESRQRQGLGKRIFQHMLQAESVEPVKMAIDRPSEKFLAFLNKHYNLNSPIKQMNNYVVFDGFFPKTSEGGKVSPTAVENNNSSPAVSKKQSANGLQTSSFMSSPYGRYGAPRPPCSMGQIIHNQSSTVQKNQEPAGESPIGSKSPTDMANSSDGQQQPCSPDQVNAAKPCYNYEQVQQQSAPPQAQGDVQYQPDSVTYNNQNQQYVNQAAYAAVQGSGMQASAKPDYQQYQAMGNEQPRVAQQVPITKQGDMGQASMPPQNLAYRQDPNFYEQQMCMQKQYADYNQAGTKFQDNYQAALAQQTQQPYQQTDTTQNAGYYSGTAQVQQQYQPQTQQPIPYTTQSEYRTYMQNISQTNDTLLQPMNVLGPQYNAQGLQNVASVPSQNVATNQTLPQPMQRQYLYSQQSEQQQAQYQQSLDIAQPQSQGAALYTTQGIGQPQSQAAAQYATQGIGQPQSQAAAQYATQGIGQPQSQGAIQYSTRPQVEDTAQYNTQGVAQYQTQDDVQQGQGFAQQQSQYDAQAIVQQQAQQQAQDITQPQYQTQQSIAQGAQHHSPDAVAQYQPQITAQYQTQAEEVRPQATTLSYSAAQSYPQTYTSQESGHNMRLQPAQAYQEPLQPVQITAAVTKTEPQSRPTYGLQSREPDVNQSQLPPSQQQPPVIQQVCPLHQQPVVPCQHSLSTHSHPVQYQQQPCANIQASQTLQHSASFHTNQYNAQGLQAVPSVQPHPVHDHYPTQPAQNLNATQYLYVPPQQATFQRPAGSATMIPAYPGQFYQQQPHQIVKDGTASLPARQFREHLLPVQANMRPKSPSVIVHPHQQQSPHPVAAYHDQPAASQAPMQMSQHPSAQTITIPQPVQGESRTAFVAPRVQYSQPQVVPSLPTTVAQSQQILSQQQPSQHSVEALSKTQPQPANITRYTLPQAQDRYEPMKPHYTHVEGADVKQAAMDLGSAPAPEQIKYASNDRSPAAARQMSYAEKPYASGEGAVSAATGGTEQQPKEQEPEEYLKFGYPPQYTKARARSRFSMRSDLH